MVGSRLIPEFQQYLKKGNANDHANLHVSSNSSMYGVHILRLLIRTSGVADIGIHIS
jgi:hypothetical protein